MDRVKFQHLRREFKRITGMDFAGDDYTLKLIVDHNGGAHTMPRKREIPADVLEDMQAGTI